MGISSQNLSFFLLCLTGFAFALGALCTNGWVILSHDIDNNCDNAHIGIKTYHRICDGISESGSLSSVLSYARYDQGGNAILGTSIVGLLFAFIGLILFSIFQYKVKREPIENIYKLKSLSIILIYSCGILFLIGVVMYAHKFNIDYSFIIFNFATFLFLASGTLLLIGTPLSAFSSLCGGGTYHHSLNNDDLDSSISDYQPPKGSIQSINDNGDMGNKEDALLNNDGGI